MYWEHGLLLMILWIFALKKVSLLTCNYFQNIVHTSRLARKFQNPNMVPIPNKGLLWVSVLKFDC